MRMIAIVLLAIWPTSLWSQGVSAVIDGPATVATGDLVKLDSARSNGSQFRWLLVNSKKTFYAADAGRVCLFASGQPGEYLFVLVVAGGDSSGRLDVSMAEHRLTVGVQPGPDPPPPPTPTPIVPDGAFGLTKLCYTLALKIPQPTRGLGKQLADNFSGVASGMVAGNYADIAAANLDLRNKNAATISNVREAWLPWAAEEAKAMQALFTSGQVKSFDDCASAYRAVSSGLWLAATTP